MSIHLVRRVLTTVLTLGLLAAVAGPTHAQFVDYDDFSTAMIDPDTWRGFTNEGAAGSPSAEISRVISGGQLHLSLRSYGGTTSDSGTALAQQGLRLKQLGVSGGTGFITGLKATVTVLGASAQDCAANSDTTVPRVQLTGTFFNDGSSTGAGDRTGDIQLYLILMKRPAGANSINFGVQRCQAVQANGSCTFQNLAGGSLTTTWALNTPIPVGFLWEQAQGKFTFVASNEAKDVAYPGGVAASGPPAVDFKDVHILNFVENCTSGRKKGEMNALVDNVRVRRQP